MVADLLSAATHESIAREVWEAVAFGPVHDLQMLRRALLDLSPSRFPKWRLRYAADLVIEIQPKPGGARDKYRLFDALALQGAGVGAGHFASAKARDHTGILELRFAITEGWALKARRYGGNSAIWASMACDQRRQYKIDTAIAALRLRDRVAAALTRTDIPAVLLARNCVICGKALKDAASIARLIGPECASTTSLRVPWTIESRSEALADALAMTGAR